MQRQRKGPPYPQQYTVQKALQAQNPDRKAHTHAFHLLPNAGTTIALHSPTGPQPPMQHQHIGALARCRRRRRPRKQLQAAGEA